MEDSPPTMDRRRLESESGLTVKANANGSIRRMSHQGVLLNLFLGDEIEGGPANIYLRRLDGQGEAIGFLAPLSRKTARFDNRSMNLVGEWRDISFSLTLLLSSSAASWFWRLTLENRGETSQTLDLIYVQDLALADYGAARSNEYYVSQYVDHSPLFHPERGVVVASRQNQHVGGRNPWCVIGSLRRGVSFATDALQVYGLSTRAGGAPAALTQGLAGKRLQHEHSLAAIQDAPISLAKGERAECGFFGWLERDHPAATSPADLAFVELALALPEAKSDCPRYASGQDASAPPSLFCSAPLLDAIELSEAEIVNLFGDNLREAEREDGRLLSFFTGERSHVALKAKERAVLRPHGHILRTGGGLIPDEAAMTSTVWMSGVFNSMLTQGHASVNRFLSTTRSYLGLFRSHGQRLFVDAGDGWRLLDEPSAFEMTPEACRWHYKHQTGLIRVESRALTETHELRLSIDVLSGAPLRLLLSNRIALDGDDGVDAAAARYERDGEGVFVRPNADSEVGRRFPHGGFRIDLLPGASLERVAGDEALFPDGVSRREPFLCLIVAPASSICFRIQGRLLAPEPAAAMETDRYWRGMSLGLRILAPTDGPLAKDAARLGEILPWFAQNALVHYLAPRGLEQFSGGGWGARDVAQGPVEMLLALGRFEPLRDLLLRLFRQQNPDGDWPQWFGIFERDRCGRAEYSHGDIVFWPLLALAKYLCASGDRSILDEEAPFFGEEDAASERTTIERHVERALTLIERRVICGTDLAAYGHGDWNDSLQPADASKRENLCSSWTVTLHHQTFVALAGAYQQLGLIIEAESLRSQAECVRKDFQRLLIVDGVLAGLAFFHGTDDVAYLLHPRDAATGVSYRLIPMIHAIINGLFTPEQARKHLALIERHLTAPDGARLFDRPMEYRGGLQKYFRRAESAAFFGREIGLMYTHAHLRYAEALWRYGDAEGFFRALCQANPIGVRSLIPSAALRQANCYFTSSDAAFDDRYEARDQYGGVMLGTVPTEGGWRIYSSGPGVAVRLILCCLLGLTQEKSALVLDPAIPPSLDGLRIEVALFGRPFEVSYRIARIGCGLIGVNLNGADLPFERRANPYRLGAAEIPIKAVRSRITAGVNRLSLRIC
ncbi:MAG: GH36-type glycosyl hydrolase domain-containing protein [Methylocystis sp.]|uniref:GH36-type glycosyl hydrolase domain-containing protein n=1 Tax=Methylocystis sp. TaxID=1911079 RepID=UPI003DA21CED